MIQTSVISGSNRIVMTVTTVKMTLQLLRIARQRKLAKVILLAILTISDFIWEDMDNYNGQRVLFYANSGHQNSAVNVQDTVSVFLLFFSRLSA
jgi:hypothetical protein